MGQNFACVIDCSQSENRIFLHCFEQWLKSRITNDANFFGGPFDGLYDCLL